MIRTRSAETVGSGRRTVAPPVGRGAHGPRWAIVCAAAVAFVLLSICLVIFVTPSLIVLVERVRPLDEDSLVRAHLLLPVAFAWFIAAIGFVRTARDRLRPKIVFGALALALAAVLVVLAGDPQDFTSEASKITYFTSVTLMLAGILGILNFLSHHYVLHGPLLLRVFWLVVGLAFIFAALDEMLVLHEKVQDFVEGTSGTSAAKAAGDAVTLLYALVALVTVGVVYRFLAPLLIAPYQWFHRVFVAAACVYAASTLLDSLDFLLISWTRHVDLVYMANAIEEIFELTAASLFAGAFLIALLECNGGWLLNHARNAITSRPARLGLVRFGVYAAAAAFAGGAIALPFLIQPDGRVILESERYDLEPFATRAQGLLRPDGMFFDDGRIYVADDTAGTVWAFDEAQNGKDILNGAPSLATPESVAVDARGTVFVTDDTMNAVFAIDGSGVRRLLGPEDGLRAPKGLTIGPDGALFVSDAQTATVYRYTDGGRLSIYATPLQLLSAPEEMAFDQAGNLYVTEEEQKRVVRIAPDGAAEIFVDESAGLRSPEAIAVKDGYVYITDAKRGAIFRFDLDGRGGEFIHFTNRYRNLEGIALGEDGAIYVASRRDDPVPSLISKITPREVDRETETTSREP